MQKPVDFDQVQAAGSFETLKVGGHILKIKEVREGKTYAGRDKVTVYFDTDKQDEQPEFYLKQFNSDTREGKKWPWNAHKDESIYTAAGTTSGFFKAFIDNVEKSNPGFKVVWGDKFCDCLKGKLVGGVFRVEEYLDNNGISRKPVKFMRWATVDEVKEGIEPPKDKLLNPSDSSSTGYGNEDMTPVDDGDIPF